MQAQIGAGSLRDRLANVEGSPLDRRTAYFADPLIESSYRDYLAERGAREGLMQWVGIGVYLFYGVLDAIAVGPLAFEFLFIRLLLVGPVGVLMVALTSLPPYRRHRQWSTVLGLALYSLSIVYMIYRMPAEGAPPYLIGLLVVMVFTSCLMRVSFLLAAPTYLLIAAVYCVSLMIRTDLAPSQATAGYFFMISVALVACITNYIQETWVRQVWLRNTQRELDAKRIEKLLVEATAADQSKINFLSILTHELRTPLHQIIGFSEVIRNKIHQGSRESFVGELDEVLGAAHRLLGKVGQMLRYADATAGKLNFSPDTVSVREMIGQLWEQFTPVAAKRGVAIDIARIAEGSVEVDPHHTLYAIANLIENALNASPDGAVVIIEGETRDDAVYALRIIDNGCGMSPELLEAAFKPFEQTEGARSRIRDGLGLGLTISKRLLDEQDAKLEIRSAVGEGTTVTVTLPRRRSAAAALSDEKVEDRLSRSA